ncbi:MAG: AAA family ATPase [Chitinispirillales bacterium]|jgi:AAA15 family ATPase/GTPase|nr:AAA family ATPase [Chitinispirillales bacterium]
MEQLYLDNFRGFSEQLIDIRNVNFLVGENSSGKSSVLMVLNSISSPRFWFNLDFHSGDDQVYSFEDLVSAEARDKSHFQIGYICDDSNGTSFLFKFTNFNGSPIISSGIIGIKGGICTFYCKEKQVKFKIVKNRKMSFNMLELLSENDIDMLETMHMPAFANGISAPALWLSFCESVNCDKKDRFLGRLPTKPITPIAPIRSKPRKTYDEAGIVKNPEGDHIPYAIRQILKANIDFSENINMFGNQSGLFKRINIKDYDSLSSDAPFRMNFVLNKKPINIVNIGYGVSQVLPILYALYTQGNNVIAIQQPEVHLHPKAQAALGDAFFDLSIMEKGKKLIVETHSDYIIDRFKQKQRKSRQKASVHVLFFLRKNGINKVFTINIDKNGNYDANQPPEFREFFIKEELENLGLQP